VVQGQVVETSSARPVAGATVQIAGTRDVVWAITNASGRYEVSGLKPGSYSVSATATGYVEGHYGRNAAAAIRFGPPVSVPGGLVTTGIDVRLQRAGSISGRVTDPSGEPLGGAEVELVRENGGGPDGLGPASVAFAQTLADGAYQLNDLSPDEYYVRAYTSRIHPTESDLAYASTFYPGAPTRAEAQSLVLSAGQELLNIDVALGVTQRFRVSGTVSDASGESLENLRVVLQAIASSGGPAVELAAPIDAVGRFEIRDVVPNAYRVNVCCDMRRRVRWVSATRTLTVTGDVADLDVRARPGADLMGRVVRDVGAAQTLDIARLGVGFEIRVAGLGFTQLGPFRVAADGAFSVESPGGPVVFKVMNVPGGWMVKSIHLDGGEIDDQPIDFGTGRHDVDVVLTDRVSAVSGVVVDRDGGVLPNHTVVVFPANPARWHSSSRFIVAAQSNNVGQFRMEPVSPGDYLAVAVAGLPMNAWTNPEVLSRFQVGAERLRIAEGQRLTIVIRATPKPAELDARPAGPWCRH
jgi:protocatechuate 3,4-dioxygenase beta subunit